MDAEVGNFFSILTEALIDLGQQTLSRNPTFHLVAGDTLELWMLKVACGMYFSAGAKDGIRIEGHAIDLDKVRRTLFKVNGTDLNSSAPPASLRR